MSRRTYVGLIAAALLLSGIPLIAESRAHVGGEQPASGSNRYSITVVRDTAILLDAVTGDTWLFSTNNMGAFSWAPLGRGATAAMVPQPNLPGEVYRQPPPTDHATPSPSIYPQPDSNPADGPSPGKE